MKNYSLLFLTIIFCASCQKKQEQKVESLDVAVTPVQLAQVETVERTEAILASGMVASTGEARLSFKLGGVIQKIYVQEGQNVSKGQLLATLDQTEINAQVSQAQLSVEKSERDFKRVRNMFKDTAATLEQMQNVTTGYEVAKKSLQIARFNQNFSRITSPIGGTVIKKLANEGELTGPGSPILFLTSNSSSNWVVRIGVTDKDWTRLKLGNEASITLDAYPDEPFSGVVTELTPIADPMNKLYEVEVKIRPNSKRLASGMFAKIELKPSQSRSYAMIPVEAIIEGEGKSAFVFVLTEDRKKVKKIPVTVGYIENDKILITNGLDNISEIVTSGGAFLTENSTVKVK